MSITNTLNWGPLNRGFTVVNAMLFKKHVGSETKEKK